MEFLFSLHVQGIIKKSKHLIINNNHALFKYFQMQL